MAVLPIPGGTLPGVSNILVLWAGMPLDDLAWPAKDPLDILPYTLDVRPFLADLGLSVAGPLAIAADPTLAVTALTTASPLVVLRIGGGVAGSQPAISILLPLTGGDQLELVVTLSVVSRAPPGLVAILVPPADLGALFAAAF